MGELEEDTNVGAANVLVGFGAVIEHLRNGGMAFRAGWDGKGMWIFKQVPSSVPMEMVEKMTSLPTRVKQSFINLDTAPNYQNQMAIVRSGGFIDSWVASSSDTFAEDWILS